MFRIDFVPFVLPNSVYRDVHPQILADLQGQDLLQLRPRRECPHSQRPTPENYLRKSRSSSLAMLDSFGLDIFWRIVVPDTSYTTRLIRHIFAPDAGRCQGFPCFLAPDCSPGLYTDVVLQQCHPARPAPKMNADTRNSTLCRKA
jgi:hypothetical protein